MITDFGKFGRYGRNRIHVDSSAAYGFPAGISNGGLLCRGLVRASCIYTGPHQHRAHFVKKIIDFQLYALQSAIFFAIKRTMSGDIASRNDTTQDMGCCLGWPYAIPAQ